MMRAPLTLLLWFSTAIAAQAASSANVTAAEDSQVFLDGKRIGTTPMHIASLGPGSHRIRVTGTRTGQSQTFDMSVPAGISVDREFHASFSGTAALVAPLAVAPLASAPVAVAAVNVETDPASHVHLDGVLVGQGSLRLTGVTPGVHLLEVVDPHTGGVMAQHVSVPAGVASEVSVPLRFHPTLGTVIVPAVVVHARSRRPRYSPLRVPGVILAPTVVIGRGGHHHSRHHRRGRF